MKKKTILAVLLMGLFSFLPLVNAEELDANSTLTDTISYKEAEIKELAKTTEGVSVEGTYTYDYSEWRYIVDLTYTITEEYDIKANNGKITLNVGYDMFNTHTFVIEPGDATIINIKIINNTKYNFSYENNSLVASTESLESELDETKESFETFDGNKINYESSLNVQRTNNAILQKLLNSSSRSNCTDEKIGNALLKIKDKDGNVKYPNGIKDLDKYYLDFFSNRDGKEYNSLYELSEEQVAVIFGFRLDYTTGYATGIRETNEAVARLGYDYFNNNLFTVQPEESKDTSDPDSKYSLGSYMRDEAPTELNDQLTEDFTDIKENSTVIKMQWNGPYTTNSYQSYSFGLNLGFKLTTETYKVITNYVDVDGNVLAEKVIELDKIDGDEYTTEEKVFEGYELVKVIGERNGNIEAADVEVTYVYEYVMGEGGEEEKEEKEVVQTGSEIDYSIMTSAFITISLIGLAIYSNRKEK